MPLTATITAGTLPPGAVYNAQTYFNAIVARMTITITGSSTVLLGQLGGSAPTGPLAESGLWFGSPTGGKGFWNDWDASAATYLPIPVVCGRYLNGAPRLTTFVCGATANRTLTTPDADGTIALTSLLTREIGTQRYSETGTVAVDWDKRVPVYIVMSSDTTINSVNAKDGLSMDFWLENASGDAAKSYAIKMAGVIWPDGKPPILSSGVTGQRVIDHVRIHRAGGIEFGEVVTRNYQIPIGFMPISNGTNGEQE